MSISEVPQRITKRMSSSLGAARTLLLGARCLITKLQCLQIRDAICIEPSTFIELLPDVLEAKRPYQYAVISGLHKAWQAVAIDATSPSWGPHGWTSIFGFLRTLVSSKSFWDEYSVPAGVWGPGVHWIPASIADFLHDGTREDSHAYPVEHFDDAFAILRKLIEETESKENFDADVMFQTINSAKGKAIEAAISQTLRMCRIDEANKAATWKRIQPLYDRELEKCKNANFEFSTLVASLLLQFEYMSPDWVEQNITKLFPTEHQNSFSAAVSGLAYSQPSRDSYELLSRNGVIDAAIQTFKGKDEYLERLVERVGVAYLWGQESLSST